MRFSYIVLDGRDGTIEGDYLNFNINDVCKSNPDEEDNNFTISLVKCHAIGHATSIIKVLDNTVDTLPKQGAIITNMDLGKGYCSSRKNEIILNSYDLVVEITAGTIKTLNNGTTELIYDIPRLEKIGFAFLYKNSIIPLVKYKNYCKFILKVGHRKKK